MLPKLARADKSFCRKWAVAFRKGNPTSPIIMEWLAKLERPAPPKPKPVHYDGPRILATVPFSSLTPMQLYQPYQYYQTQQLPETMLYIDTLGGFRW